MLDNAFSYSCQLPIGLEMCWSMFDVITKKHWYAQICEHLTHFSNIFWLAIGKSFLTRLHLHYNKIWTRKIISSKHKYIHIMIQSRFYFSSSSFSSSYSSIITIVLIAYSLFRCSFFFSFFFFFCCSQLTVQISYCSKALLNFTFDTDLCSNKYWILIKN